MRATPPAMPATPPTRAQLRPSHFSPAVNSCPTRVGLSPYGCRWQAALCWADDACRLLSAPAHRSRDPDSRAAASGHALLRCGRHPVVRRRGCDGGSPWRAPADAAGQPTRSPGAARRTGREVCPVVYAGLGAGRRGLWPRRQPGAREPCGPRQRHATRAGSGRRRATPLQAASRRGTGRGSPSVRHPPRPLPARVAL